MAKHIAIIDNVDSKKHKIGKIISLENILRIKRRK